MARVTGHYRTDGPADYIECLTCSYNKGSIHCKDCFQKLVDIVADYEDADCEGRLVKLPVRINQPAYSVELMCDAKDNIDKNCIKCKECNESHYKIIPNFYESYATLIGDRWKFDCGLLFADEEDAKQKLEELEEENE